eukprot:TRINITY_DN3914_c0_g1_i7.p1 TRINITY_DN3914_c0_g1~~TRINITY_DN3914_c0_g1_i7.p1  ORF type:complete len:365 (+),score=39.33 TRINITY_DN3914_c0_g1_i7:573-1667(+)
MDEKQEAPIDFDLTCWYLNKRRIIELIGGGTIPVPVQPGTPGTANEFRRRLDEMGAFKDAIGAWMRGSKPPTLGQLLLADTARPGAIFTHFTNWYFKGVPQMFDAMNRGGLLPKPALAYAKLDGFQAGLRVECRFHGEHMTSGSSWSELSGQKPMLILGLITNVTNGLIESIPYVIANLLPNFFFKPTSVIGKHWTNKLEVFVDLIDNFDRVRSVRAPSSIRGLEPLKNISERAIKESFAQIIGEPDVPKDWGGERSDLVSNRVMIDGARISTAFAFKGPAQFREMTLAQLGKNGDQIDRLFSEPADLLILQHCHKVAPSVRSTMRAYAQQMGRPRLFCIIDGYDTVRVLRAYSKCGFKRGQAG